jgi:glycine/D-amino acid oxidase-like deaminating enzyme
MLIAHAGVIHPMNYARSLARTVREKGGTIFENSAVVSVKYEAGGVEASTGSGIARAKKLIIATNGYSHLTRATAPIRKAIIPFRSAMIATDRIPQDIFATVVPNGRSCSETRRMMRWFRRIDDRLLYGGRGAFGKADSDGAFKALEKALRATFPQLEAISITHRWSGLVAMTLDSLPQMGLLDKNTAYSIGYNGTGIAMATLFGRHVMDLVLGEEVDLPLMRRDRPLDIPFYAFREPVVRVVAGWYQFLDRIGR